MTSFEHIHSIILIFPRITENLIFLCFLTHYDKRGIFSFYELVLKIYFAMWFLFEYNFWGVYMLGKAQDRCMMLKKNTRDTQN